MSAVALLEEGNATTDEEIAESVHERQHLPLRGVSEHPRGDPRVLNSKPARSQLMGGTLWGLGQALLEGNRMDARYGRWGASNLGEYLVPVDADAPEVTVDFVEVHDTVVNPLGVKGVGEIGQVGVAAAIADAVLHATGRRIRELPMAAELVMDAAPVPA